MPGKQQEIIVLAVVGLIAVMVAFALFDHFKDEGQFADPAAVAAAAEPAAAGALIGAMPCPVAAAAGVNVNCAVCGWRGQCPMNGRCPNCRVFFGNSNLNSGLFGSFPPADAQNAAFLWNQPQALPRVRPCGVLYCPSCNFAMNCPNRVAPNTIRCPRCPGFLMNGTVMANAGSAQGAQAAGGAGAAQQAAFIGGYGRGMNPWCPNVTWQ